MNKSEKEQSVVDAFAWNLCERISVQGTQFVVSIILARILSPDDYGIISLITAFIAISFVVVEQGVSSAVIQRKKISKREINSLFTIGFFASIVLYVGLLLLAPSIAMFYDKYESQLLIRLIRVYALVLPIGSFTTIQSAIIYRNMQFRKSFSVNLIGIIISSTVGILLAIMGYGVWALAMQQITSRIVNIVALTIVMHWIPHPVMPDKEIIPSLTYSAHILGNSLLSTSYNQIRSLLIGKYYASYNLAYYNKGEMFPAIIATNTDYALQKVMFSAYSKKQDNINEVKTMMRKTINLSTFFLAPMMLGLIAVSKELVLLVLTEKWLACVPFMQVFCLVYFLQPIKTTIGQAFNGIGRSKTTFHISLLSTAIGILFIIAVLKQGTIYIAIVAFITEIFISAFYIIMVIKHFSYSIGELFSDIALNVITAIFMYIGLIFVSYTEIFSVWLSLVFKILAGIGIYYILNLVVGNKALTYSANLIRSKLTKFESPDNSI